MVVQRYERKLFVRLNCRIVGLFRGEKNTVGGGLLPGFVVLELEQDLLLVLALLLALVLSSFLQA